jgi:hypothetical protein
MDGRPVAAEFTSPGRASIGASTAALAVSTRAHRTALLRWLERRL